MDSQDQAAPLADPPSLEVMVDPAGQANNPPTQQQEQPQSPSDSQMEDALQEVSSQSSSQMPELEQMEGGPDVIAEEDSTSQSAPDVEAMETGETQQTDGSPPKIVEDQVSTATSKEVLTEDGTKQGTCTEKSVEVLAVDVKKTAAECPDVQGSKQEEKPVLLEPEDPQVPDEGQDKQVKDAVTEEQSPKEIPTAVNTDGSIEKNEEDDQGKEEESDEPMQKKAKLDAAATKEQAKDPSSKQDESDNNDEGDNPSVSVQTPRTSTRQAAKQASNKNAQTSSDKITTPKNTENDQGVRRSSRRKSSTPKWRPKDLLESESEEEESEDDDDDVEEVQEKEVETAKPVTRKRGRPLKNLPVAQTATNQKGRKIKIKTEPPDRPVKIKQEPDPDWYTGRAKSVWTDKEERSLVLYIVDWQKQAPMEEEEEEEEPDDGKMTSKQFAEMNLMIPEKSSDKEWRDCADFVSKSTQKPVRSVRACYQFAMTIQECMTNEGAMEHYDFNDDKVKKNYQSAIYKKPLRGKTAGEKSLWTDEEEQALVVFIMHWQLKRKQKMIRVKPAKTRRKSKRAAAVDENDFRIMPPKSEMWEDCAKFISRKTCLPKRTGAACHSYAVGIQKEYTKQEALEEYNIRSDYESDVEEAPTTESTNSDKYMQDESFLFNQWQSEMGKLTSFQEEHVLHRLLLKKINRGEFSSNDFMYYFKHLPKSDQKETADVLVAHGYGKTQANSTEEDSKKDASTGLVAQYKKFASEKQRSMDNFSKQIDTNMRYSEKQIKNMKDLVSKTQAENKYLLEKMKSMMEVIDRLSDTKRNARKTPWSSDMDTDLNEFRKKNLFQWLLLNGYIPRMPKNDIIVPKGLMYCIFTAIEELEQQSRPNSVFHLAKALCLRKTNGERVMPANRMPFALLEANIMFFGGKGYNFSQQEGYKRWVETQYAWFGEVWFSLFGGPNMKSMAGEEPKPLGGFDGDITDGKLIKTENDEMNETGNAGEKSNKKYSLTLCPEGYTPPEGNTEFLKVGQRWGKLTLLTPIEGEEGGYTAVETSNAPQDSEEQQEGIRRTTRRQAKGSQESAGTASGEDTPSNSKSRTPSKQSNETVTPGAKRRNGKAASIEYRPTKIAKVPKTEQNADGAPWQTEDVQKFLDSVHTGEISEFDVWTKPPNFSFEDDFIVPENSDLNKVRLNVVSATPRSIQRRGWDREPIIQPSAEIEEDMLKQLKSVNPDGRWWIKTGWCDITSNKALRVTSKLEFTGDEDLGDGTMLEVQEQFRDRLKKTRAIGVGARKNENTMREDLFRQIAHLQDDNAQLCEGLRRVRATKGVYKSKMGVPERAAVDEAVDREIASYVKLLERNQELRVRVERALSQGVKARVINLRNDLAEYQTNFTTRMRTIANYVLIFMISDETQGAMPYSWPVRVVPVNAITRELVETLRDELVEAMHRHKMKIVGLIRDELTPHLATGNPDRPVCITQLIDESRMEASTFHPSEMEKYFTIVTLYTRSGDLKLTPQWRHGAVPEDDVIWVYNYMNSQNVTFLEALQALHKKMFPPEYMPYQFRSGSRHHLESEMLEDQLRGLMAIYLYRHKIRTYQAEDVDFENYLYVPAKHPLTKQPIQVRDSVTKLLRSISRQAKDDKDLTVEKKQRLSIALDSWFKAAVNTWWTPEMRHEGNQGLLTFVLEEWIPYAYPADRKYSAIDVNRPIGNVCFLSEDLLTSLIVNVESENQCPSLHPIAATCQDVNTFVHLIKNPGQRQNDSRQIMHPQIIKKLSIEFAKAIDPSLEFYYYWGDHEKTLYNILLNLNDPRTKRSATGPKYRKKTTPGPKKGGKVMKGEAMVVEEDEHSKDTMEDYDEEMDMSINAEVESTSSSHVIDLPPIPIAINQVAADGQKQREQATIVTVTAPPGAEGAGVVQQTSSEDIMAAELLRQIEASLQAGVAVVTVTESPQGESITVTPSSQQSIETESTQPIHVSITESAQRMMVASTSQSVAESAQPIQVAITESAQRMMVASTSQSVAESAQPIQVAITESAQRMMVASTSQPVAVTVGSPPMTQNSQHVEGSQYIAVTKNSEPVIAVTESSQHVIAVTESSQPVIAVTESSQPVIAVTESSQPVTAVTESSQPVIVVTESLQPSTAVTESSQPVIVVTESSHPSTAVTESSHPVIVVTESSQPVKAVTESSQPVIAVTDSSQPIIAVTESSQPIIAVTESSQPIIAVTESSQPIIAVTESLQPVIAVTESLQPIIAVTESLQPITTSDSPQQLVYTETSQPVSLVEVSQSSIISGSPQSSAITESSQSVTASESPHLVAVTQSLQTVAMPESSQTATTSESHQPLVITEISQAVSTSESEQPVIVTESSQPVTMMEVSQVIPVSDSSQPLVVVESSQAETAMDTLQSESITDNVNVGVVESSQPLVLNVPAEDMVNVSSQGVSVSSQGVTVAENLQPIVVTITESSESEMINDEAQPDVVTDSTQPEVEGHQ